MWNLVIGAGMIIGGLSGKMALIGTGSPMALVAVGAGLAGFGGYQLLSKRQK